jgi:hypothetical protein
MAALSMRPAFSYDATAKLRNFSAARPRYYNALEGVMIFAIEIHATPRSLGSSAASTTVASTRTRSASILPVASPATPIAATTKQQDHNNNNEDQFHSKSPLK